MAEHGSQDGSGRHNGERAEVRSAFIQGAVRTRFVDSVEGVHVEVFEWWPDGELQGSSTAKVAVVLPLAHISTVGMLYAGRPLWARKQNHVVTDLPGPASELNGLYSASNAEVANLLTEADHGRLAELRRNTGPFEVRFMPGSISFLQAFDDMTSDSGPQARASFAEAVREVVDLLKPALNKGPLNEREEQLVVRAIHLATGLQAALAGNSPG